MNGLCGFFALIFVLIVVIIAFLGLSFKRVMDNKVQLEQYCYEQALQIGGSEEEIYNNGKACFDENWTGYNWLIYNQPK